MRRLELYLIKVIYMSQKEILELETQIMQATSKLEKLRRDNARVEVTNYKFQSLSGPTDMLSLFGSKNKLFVIHNMGQGCRWCTSWADVLNATLPHLENSFAVVLASKDSPEVQRQFALSRQWRFRMVSHSDSNYISEQSVSQGETNAPGIVLYEKEGSKIFKKNYSSFGPGDMFNPLFHVVSLAGVGAEEFVPQFQYWKRPEKMDDGGANL